MSAARVETLRPIASGFSTQWAPSSGTNWECVNEAVLYETDYVATSSPVFRLDLDLYTIETPSILTSSDYIDSITVHWVWFGGKGDRATSPAIRENGTTTIGTTIESAPSDPVETRSDSQTWTTCPSTSAAWTYDDILDLQIGVKYQGGVATFTYQVYVEVNITQPTIITDVDDAYIGLTSDNIILSSKSTMSVNDAYIALHSDDINFDSLGDYLPGHIALHCVAGTGVFTTKNNTRYTGALSAAYGALLARENLSTTNKKLLPLTSPIDWTASELDRLLNKGYSTIHNAVDRPSLVWRGTSTNTDISINKILIYRSVVARLRAILKPLIGNPITSTVNVNKQINSVLSTTNGIISYDYDVVLDAVAGVLQIDLDLNVIGELTNIVTRLVIRGNSD